MDRTKYQIQIPLPPKIDASVTMMQVEEKPDVTYSDVGGCKEQIEKLREVVETPLLSVGSKLSYAVHFSIAYSQNALSTLALTLQRACCCMALRAPERLCVPVPLQTEPTQLSSVLLVRSLSRNMSEKVHGWSETFLEVEMCKLGNEIEDDVVVEEIVGV